MEWIVWMPGAIVVVWGIRHWYFVQLRDSEAQQKTMQDDMRFLGDTIHTHSHYFQLLDYGEKELFLKRAWFFYKHKRYEARGFDCVSAHMRAVIAAYAAQITFGLPEIRLKHFQTVIVYSSAYRSTITRNWHKGEIHSEGAIVFSWTDLAEGHNQPSDGVNVALHELAHALHLENIIINGEHDFLDRTSLHTFRELAELEMASIQQQPSHFLRTYASANDFEFFAVCVESFFERPVAFRKELPHIYDCLCTILKQNPVSRYV